MSALDTAETRVQKFASGVDKAAIFAAGALAGIGAGAKTVIDAASELQQSQGAVSAIFGENADAIASLGADAADRLGLAQSEYGNLASLLGSQLQNMGTAASDLAPQTDQLISLGSDLAATYGGSTADAVSAVSSLLKGERDPIERYGVSIKQADIEAQKLAMGLDGLTGEAAKNADMQATLALLTDQTGSAQGMFASEADTAAGAQARATAAWQDAAATLGEALLPIVTTVMESLAGLAGWAAENSGLITGMAIAVGIISAAIIGLSIAMKIYTAAQQMQTIAQAASNAAWLSSPVTWIILAVLALIAAVVLLWNNWDAVWGWMQAAAANVANWFLSAWGAVVNWFRSAWGAVAGWFRGIWSGIASFFAGIVNGIRSAWAAGMSSISSAVSSVGNFIGSIFQGVGNFIGTIVRGVVNSWTSAFNAIRSVVQGVANFIDSIFRGIQQTVQNVIGGIQNAINWAGDLIGLSANMPAPVLDTDGIPSYLTLSAEIPQSLQFAQPALRDLGRIAPAGASSSAAPTIITVNVDGALDPVSTAKQIERILKRNITVGASRA